MVASKGQKKRSPNDTKGSVAVCPLGKDVPAILSAIAKKQTKKAAQSIQEANALPSICGRVCLAPCTRGPKKDGITAAKLRQFAEVAGVGTAAVDDKAPTVAVIGAGPAGLAAAHRLLQAGVKPIVFESADQAGGLLADVIPAFVLPRKTLANDIANLAAMGAEIRLGVKAGADMAWGEFEDDYDAVLVATGAGQGVMPSIPGADLKGATNAIDFCRAAENGTATVGAGVVVQGGSLAALQVARVAVQLGAEDVHVVHPFPLELWPVTEDEIKAAKKEGIELVPNCRVAELWGYGAVEKVVARPALNALTDSAGRVAGGDQGAEIRFEATTFIAAVNRKSPEQPKLNGIGLGLLGNLAVDTEYKLKRPGWYGAGETATGAAGVVDSMVTGRLAAEAIMKDLEAK